MFDHRTRTRLSITLWVAALAVLASLGACSSGSEAGTGSDSPEGGAADPADTPGDTAEGTSGDTDDDTGNDVSEAESDEGAVELTLLTHGSFDISDEVLEAFTDETGHTVEVVRGGDAGELVNRSVLTAGNPEADVMFGVDNTFLSAALDADVFEARSESAVDEFADVIDPALLDEQNRVVPVDFGDVCLNYDRAWFEENDLAPPGSLVALTDPTYRGLTVVEDPTTSSPGMAFMLSTIAKFGEGADEGFENFWAALRENEVAVVAGWEEAYYGRFTWGSEGEGDRPIVVSYASSPPVDVIFGEYATPPDVAPTAVIEDGCFRQVEYAGVMAGTDNSDAAGELVDFMLTEDFQADIPLKMFVFPIRDDIELPEEFVKYTSVPEEPSRMEPAEIDANRSDWLDTWDEVMAG